VVYQGHHGDKGAHRADVVLPGAANREGRHLRDTEGRAQLAQLAIFRRARPRKEWAILRALSERRASRSPTTLSTASRQALSGEPALPALNAVEPVRVEGLRPKGKFCGERRIGSLRVADRNYYMTDPISRASITMAECTRRSCRRSRDGTHA